MARERRGAADQRERAYDELIVPGDAAIHMVNHYALLAHPACGKGAAHAVQVELRCDARTRLIYRVEAPATRLRVPVASRAQRRDDLWQHTCCELFVLAPGGAYREFNFSPSGDWAAWWFRGYREGCRDLDLPAPGIGTQFSGTLLEVSVELDLALADADGIGLACVIESIDGDLSYWALAHPAASPDFHHPAGFLRDFAHASASRVPRQ